MVKSYLFLNGLTVQKEWEQAAETGDGNKTSPGRWLWEG